MNPHQAGINTVGDQPRDMLGSWIGAGDVVRFATRDGAATGHVTTGQPDHNGRLRIDRVQRRAGAIGPRYLDVAPHNVTVIGHDDGELERAA